VVFPGPDARVVTAEELAARRILASRFRRVMRLEACR
jgi:hypothetical protein